MKYGKAFIGSALTVVILSACGGVPTGGGEIETGPTAGMSEVEYVLEDGRVVTCIMYDGVREASISCDWEGAK